MNQNSKNIVLASGGTGGHIFPAESLAEELSARGYNPVLITDSRYGNYGSPPKGMEIRTIKASIFGGGIIKRISSVIDMTIGYFQAGKILKELKPAVVVGFGGYPSFPTMFYAVRNKFKTIIHEQNSMLGKANYILADKVDVIATSFDDVAGISDSDMKKSTLTGNPVRPAIKVLRGMDYPELSSSSVLKILITGGSQGASVFSEVVPEALKQLPSEYRKRIRIDQQCREDDIEKARAAYDEMGVSADLATFFNDMPARLASAHLVIARSGASTIAEVTTVGRPALLVPYPHSKDDHQRVNATSLEDVGGGWVMPQEAFTPAALAQRIEGYLNLPATLITAAEKAREAGIPDADKNLADIVESLANSSNGGKIDAQESEAA